MRFSWEKMKYFVAYRNGVTEVPDVAVPTDGCENLVDPTQRGQTSVLGYFCANFPIYK